MSKRIKFKEIKQGVTGYAVSVGFIQKIVFTGRPYTRKIGNRKVYAVNLIKFVNGKPYPTYEFLSDMNITSGSTGIRANETNCILRSRKAAEKYVLDTKQNVIIHNQRMKQVVKEHFRENYLY